MRFKPRTLILLALFTAMAILFRRILNIHFPIGIISFAGFPIVLAGLLFGPAAGGLVGAVSDILGYPLFPAGPYSPFFTITAALTGIIPALLFKTFRREHAPLWLLTLFIFAGQFITKVLLVPYFLQLHFGVPFLWKSISNLVVEIIHAPIYALLSQMVLSAYGELYPLEIVNKDKLEFKHN
jgi:riboflavin transporter